MTVIYSISKHNLLGLLERVSSRSKVYVPYKKGETLSLGPFDAARKDSIELGEIRSSQPIKTFLTLPRKVLSETKDAKESVIIAGIKACDLASLKLQDFVFKKGDYEDPFYVKNRDNLTIISCDCTSVRETCFCVAMAGKPYPEKEFDISLSIVGDNYLVESSGKKGQAILDEFRTFFTEADEKDIAAREKTRAATCSRVESFINARGTPATKDLKGAVMKNYASQIWKDFYSTCVECGACNLACPTCHCFLLFDETGKNGPSRFMEWDACLYARFARVAGGANPRKHLWERLRNRFEKKFDFFPKVLDMYACTGCGRCIEACPGDIDIREVLKGLVTGKWNNPPNT